MPLSPHARQGASNSAWYQATHDRRTLVEDEGTTDENALADAIAAIYVEGVKDAARAGAIAGLRGEPQPIVE